MTISEAVEYGKGLLLSVLRTDMPGLSIEELESEASSNVYFLLSGLLKMIIPQLRFKGSEELSQKKLDTYNLWLEKRLNLEPVQYIVGETEFWSLPFYVGKGVLIPRQDTECLVSEINKHFKDKEASYQFLDLGCGCGCIGISLMSIFPNSEVLFLDKEPIALEYTKKNLKRHKLEKRGRVLQSDIFSILPEDAKFDAIVSNPPYIVENELKSLSMQITLFEPLSALNGGPDGLFFYKMLASQAMHFLKPKAPLFLEIGYNQADELKKIFKSWNRVRIQKDLSANPRVLLAFRD